MKTKNMITSQLKNSVNRAPSLCGPILIVLGCITLSPMLQAQSQNTAFGVQALISNTRGDKNTAIGYKAMHDNTTGLDNTATGFQALSSNTIGDSNTAVGWRSLDKNIEGNANTATGANALANNLNGDANTANGDGALGSNTTGHFNAATGARALSNNTIGGRNTAIGRSALSLNTTGNFNTANGYQALFNNTTGNFNIALGSSAGASLTTGDSNIDIGNVGFPGESHTIRIGGPQTKTFIAGISGVTVTGAGVFVNPSGQLGTLPSSERFKDETKPMDKASEAILALKPVTFRYKQGIDPARSPQFGLVAEDVEKVNPDLVVRDAEGKVNTVRYEAVNAMLLNEFLKEHKKVEDLEGIVASLAATVKEQAAQIQKVSAQLEVSRPALQTVLNNQ
jgi:hypothetical protein